MNDLRELYQEVILDHSRHPRHFREMPEASHHADGHNPLCGDRITVYLHVNGDVIEDVTFQGAGCSISTASASMMTQALRGKTIEEATALFDRFHDLVTSDPGQAAEKADAAPELGKLAVFQGVSEFPMRVKCATLAWHTLKAAISDGGEAASTE